MQFSKRVTQLSTLYSIDPKDVLFALLVSAGASTPEAFAAIYRPQASTTAALQSKATYYISQRPGLKKALKELQEQAAGTAHAPAKRPGRPRLNPPTTTPTPDPAPLIDYTDKDALLKELATIASRSDKESDRLAALKEIGSLQRMKSEAAIQEEKRVTMYIPLSYTRCGELLNLLAEWRAARNAETR